jgi:hypothetical protein
MFLNIDKKLIFTFMGLPFDDSVIKGVFIL